jgi:hypothetical protein
LIKSRRNISRRSKRKLKELNSVVLIRQRITFMARRKTSSLDRRVRGVREVGRTIRKRVKGVFRVWWLRRNRRLEISIETVRSSRR